MSTERYVVLGLARPRSDWSTDVGRWATTAAIPVEYIRCLSIDELRARLDTGRRVSAVLLDTNVAGVDRDLLELINGSGAVVVAVSPVAPSNWPTSIDATWLAPDFDRQQLLDVLAVHALAVHRADEAHAEPRPLVANPWSGTLVSITGHPGAGASTVAMGLAQAFGADPRNLGMVLLADLALDADQAMLHDATRLVPGLQEAVEAHRNGGVSPHDIRELVRAIDGRGYDLLLGLRHHRDWTALRPRAVAAMLDNLRVTYRMVIADVDADIEGLDQTGSADMEDRNQLARLTFERSAAIVVVGMPGLNGIHKLCRTLHRLIDQGVDPDRLVPVINQMRGGVKARAETSAAIGQLVRPEWDVASPTFVPAKKHLEAGLVDGRGLPNGLFQPVAAAAEVIVDRNVHDDMTMQQEPVAVAPGSLGAFLDEGGEA